MNLWDFLILASIAISAVLAVRHTFRGRGGGCHGSCVVCRKQCIPEEMKRINKK